jgi:hypothetical protein
MAGGERDGRPRQFKGKVAQRKRVILSLKIEHDVIDWRLIGFATIQVVVSDSARVRNP